MRRSMPNVIDEFTRERLTIRVRPEAPVDRRQRRLVEPIHSARRAGLRPVGQRPEFAAKAVSERIVAVGFRTAFIDVGQSLGDRRL